MRIARHCRTDGIPGCPTIGIPLDHEATWSGGVDVISYIYIVLITKSTGTAGMKKEIPFNSLRPHLIDSVVPV